MNELSGGLYVIVFLFLLVLAILWFFLPFAIFGTKDILQKLLAEQILTNKKLDQLINPTNPAYKNNDLNAIINKVSNK